MALAVGDANRITIRVPHLLRGGSPNHQLLAYSFKFMALCIFLLLRITPFARERRARALNSAIMKTIGLIGGMSWESTVPYYRIINETVRDRLGGLHSARCILWSFDFHEIETLQHRGDWDELTRRMIDAAISVERAGADLLVICTNTMHKMADEVAGAIRIPLVHIADATAAAIRAANLTKVGLLATRFTMEEDFYTGRLKTRHGIEILIPDEPDRKVVHDVIYNELCAGTLRDRSREKYKTIIQRLVAAGVQGIILGCTEIGLLIESQDSPVPLFDTTPIHAAAAVDSALT